MAPKYWMWFIIPLYIRVESLQAAEVCVQPSPHKDVNSNIVAAIVEKVPDSQQCITRCATLKDSLPCRGAVYIETTARSTTKALCKMYSRSAKQPNSLIDVTDLAHNDATYYDVQDQCTADSQRLNLDPAPPDTDPNASSGQTQQPMPGVIVVQPVPGGNAPGPAGPDSSTGGVITAPPAGAQISATIATTKAPQVPSGAGAGGGPFVPGPNAPAPAPSPSGGAGGGPFVPGPAGPQPPQPGAQGGNGAFVPGPNGPQPPGGAGSLPQPGGGVYPKPAGYTPPPAYGAGGYGGWSAWGQCTVTCGGGVMYRNRVCDSGGCQGRDKELKTCYARKSCPAWGPWTDWGPCSAPCGSGTQIRTRQCQGGYGCAGTSSDTQSCSSSGASCYNPQPVYIPQPVHIPRPAPAPQPHSYYDAFQRQYYRNRG